MTNFSMDIVGISPLLVHNAQLSNPLNPFAKDMKKISGKRTKTEDDYLDLAKLEHAGSLYYDPDLGPVMPTDNLFRCLYDAGKKHKLGVRIKEAIVFTSADNAHPIEYIGPRDPDGLWNDQNFVHSASVKVGMNRVTRTRPQFRQWEIHDVVGVVDPNLLDFGDLQMIVETAGTVIGLGDWRPKFGRFHATIKKVS